MGFDIAIASSTTGALLYVILGIVLLLNWRRGVISTLLVVACLISAIWFGLQVVQDMGGATTVSAQAVQLGEIVRDAAWYSLLTAILSLSTRHDMRRRYVYGIPLLIATMCAVQAGLVLLPGLADALRSLTGSHGSMRLRGFLLLAVLGLVLVEQVLRNTRAERRWAVRAFCLGVGGLFAYDIFLYSHAVLFNTIASDLWNIRGAVNALSVPLIALSVVRNPEWKADLFVSRQVVFHSTALIGVGGYLLLMAGVGYYIREFGGSWGGALQTLFFVGAIMMLVVVMSSTQMRARAKVFLVKHFYKNKYEYREEWLNFTRTLADSEGKRGALEQLIVRATAGIMESRWGTLWLRHEANFFVPVAGWESGPLPTDADEPVDSSLACFLEQRGWIIDLDEVERDPVAYDGLAIPDWLQRMTNAWLVIPLQQKTGLQGFIVLARSLAKNKIDWEDRDLLKTVAQQAVGYLVLLDVTEDLARAKQFEAYNRLSAFVVHDLKNLAAQLNLIATNAARYRDNPQFIDDAFTTVADAVAKMNRMLAALRAGRAGQIHADRVDLARLLQGIVDERKLALPAPALEVSADATVSADRAQLAKAVSHLVQNAQEATSPDGYVRLSLAVDGALANIEIADNGSGMDHRFIREHLFQPFDTTKGNAGMGIGVFEARQIVLAAGGEIAVESTPGAGTTFTIRLPIAQPASDEGLGLQVVGDKA